MAETTKTYAVNITQNAENDLDEIILWRIIYKIENNDVYILMVIDGRRNVSDIVMKKLIPSFDKGAASSLW